MFVTVKNVLPVPDEAVWVVNKMATPLGLDLHLGTQQPQVAKSQGAPENSSSCPLSSSQGGQHLRDIPQPQYELCGQVKPSALQWDLARSVSSCA